MDVNDINKFRSLPVPTQSNLIDGRKTGAANRIDVISPIDGVAFTQIAAASGGDVDAAVAAARAAFDDGRWRAMAPGLAGRGGGC